MQHAAPLLFPNGRAGQRSLRTAHGVRICNEIGWGDLTWVKSRLLTACNAALMPRRSGSLRGDMRLADRATVTLVLLAQVSGELPAASADRRKPLRRELGFQRRRLQRAGEPAGELSHPLGRRVCR